MMKLIQERFASSKVTPADAASKAESTASTEPGTLNKTEPNAHRVDAKANADAITGESGPKPNLAAALAKRRGGIEGKEGDDDDNWDDDERFYTPRGKFGQARRRFL